MDLDTRKAAEELKSKGPLWGEQDGLLSTAELEVLMQAILRWPESAPSVLEVGHYYGLSTAALVTALKARGGEFRLLTVDSYEEDRWVPTPATHERFQENRVLLFDDPRLVSVVGRSQSLSAPILHEIVFYDADHGEEQLRFTEEVLGSPMVGLFIFDDSDFEVPKRCVELLLAAGWEDHSPKLQRFSGDKMNPETQTLAIFRRPSMPDTPIFS